MSRVCPEAPGARWVPPEGGKSAKTNRFTKPVAMLSSFNVCTGPKPWPSYTRNLSCTVRPNRVFIRPNQISTGSRKDFMRNSQNLAGAVGASEGLLILMLILSVLVCVYKV